MQYFISDTHLNHANIIRIDGRDFHSVNDMNEYIIEKNNKKVKPTDDLYIIGDFAFGEPEKIVELAKRFNGTRHLITGNHDKVKFLFNTGAFSEIVPYKKVFVQNETFKQYNTKGVIEVILSHYPYAVWDKQHYGAAHIYGHVHANSKANPLVDLNLFPNAYNAFSKHLGYEPFTLMEFMDKYGYDPTFYNFKD